jgi:integrase
VQKIKTEGKDASEREAFTPDELSILLNYAPLFDGGVSVAVMLLAGYRPGEMIGLQWESIDFSLEVIHLYHAAAIGEDRHATIVGSNKKKNHDRDTPIHPVLKEILLTYFFSEYHRLLPDSKEKTSTIEMFLYSPKKNPLRKHFLFGIKSDNHMLHPYSYKKVYKRFMDAVNEVSKKKVRDLIPYSCRHTFSTECDKAGISNTQMKYLMGHKVQDVTGHYTHPDMDSLKAAIRRISIKAFEEIEENKQEPID